jgi:uroporphyrinogen decarboxylase
MIGTQSTMPFGTEQDVRAAVERLAAFASNGARIVVGPTHVLEPDALWRRIRALVQTVGGIRL